MGQRGRPKAVWTAELEPAHICCQRDGMLVLRTVLVTGSPGRHVEIVIPPGLALPLWDALSEGIRHLR